ncbi:dentin sialophosphoprotein-like [Drosophila obscura]|uniref:dentin sialophosphoprotein-like n=1 Tax=Drosophila obscura TaxID=7282 RepID=UPI001BB186F1|nr:dentin sialophosphoprotein-like [Drosophila obscura]
MNRINEASPIRIYDTDSEPEDSISATTSGNDTTSETTSGSDTDDSSSESSTPQKSRFTRENLCAYATEGTSSDPEKTTPRRDPRQGRGIYQNNEDAEGSTLPNDQAEEDASADSSREPDNNETFSHQVTEDKTTITQVLTPWGVRTTTVHVRTVETTLAVTRRPFPHDDSTTSKRSRCH